MRLRVQIFLLVALVALLIADNAAAREETKTQEGAESTDIATGGKEKSNMQKDEIKSNTEKVHMKQKWQRYKTPSSKKIKKADSWKEKGARKSGKEKWKAGVEDTSKQKKKRSTDSEKHLHHNGKGKWVKKDKIWKHETSRAKQSQVNEELNLKESEFTKNKEKVRYSKEVKGKVLKKDKMKSEMSGSVCLKEEPCTTDNKINKIDGKSLWKGKQKNGESNSPKSEKLSKVNSNPESYVNGLKKGKEIEQLIEDRETHAQNSNQDNANSESENTYGAEAKEETEPKANEKSNKKKTKVSISEQKENLSMEPEKQIKLSKSKGLKIRRYIVEEHVVDDTEVGEVAESDSEIPQLMQ